MELCFHGALHPFAEDDLFVWTPLRSGALLLPRVSR
jgi:hypothetical protein